MTPDDEKLEKFFDDVVADLAGKVLGEENTNFHYPSVDCFEDACAHRSAFPVNPTTLLCNWENLLHLSAWFLKYGPEVDDVWEKVVQNIVVEPGALHELLLGIFIGGSEGGKGWFNPCIHLYEVNLDYAKAGENLALRIPETPETPETPKETS